MPLLLAAVPALALARLLPAEGGGLALRLAAATACLLLPGALLGRAVGFLGAAPALVWSLGALFAALAAVFAVEGSLTLALGLLAAIGVAALPFALRRRPAPVRVGPLAVAAAGAAFGVALWYVAGPPGGDALFHLARARKLHAFDSLSLENVGEFADGGFHPGYAFPLWHGFLALVAELAGVDPAAVVLHEASVLAPLAFLVVYEAGLALFRSAWAAAAVVIAHVTLSGLAPAGGGAYASLALPATSSRHLLVPAVLALAFSAVGPLSPGLLGSIAAGGLALALVHPTYALFVALTLAGYLLARLLLVGSDWARIAAGLAALALPTAGVVLWLRPIVEETASHEPSASELRRALAHYASQLDVFSRESYRLAPELFGRGGTVAIAALVLVPLAAFAARRRWAAFVLGGSLSVLAVTLTPFLFPRFADAVSLSQARRLAGFFPYAFAFAGGAAVLARLLRVAVLPLALGAGFALQAWYPGDFGYALEEGGPALVTWVAAFGGAAALAAAAILRGDGDFERPGKIAALAAALFVLPTAVETFSDWKARAPERGPRLTAGLVSAVRDGVPPGAVVFSDLETSYRLAAYAPIYVAAPPRPPSPAPRPTAPSPPQIEERPGRKGV